jgi:hypothetical protein
MNPISSEEDPTSVVEAAFFSLDPNLCTIHSEYTVTRKTYWSILDANKVKTMPRLSQSMTSLWKESSVYRGLLFILTFPVIGCILMRISFIAVWDSIRHQASQPSAVRGLGHLPAFLKL